MTSSSQTKQNVVPINRSGTSNADFLSTHNAVRLLIGHSPLTWNDTIAYFAEQWARKRVNDCELIHSGGPYGENLFWGGSPTDWSPTTVVKIWAAEKAFYDPKSNSCAKNHMCGHYTQIVWKDTLRVSCASVKWNNNKGTYVICNYDPPASYLNKHPFGNFAMYWDDAEEESEALVAIEPIRCCPKDPNLASIEEKCSHVFKSF
ncbi:hypothetical protein Gohar_017233 [Gossypium harknessii]|uniref:SCP domain-containing protein n=1 Tax=Gossypium harknessii TaxID=34285 RepID=A0A7J9G5M5_9ROSI|nr:hypothetical protein [Gossypium harknessii]